MNESISDAILDSGEESILRAYAGLSITAGGVSLQRSELPQSVTVAGALSTKGESSPVVSGDAENINGVANNYLEGPTYLVNPETKDGINGEDIVVTIIAPETDLGEGGKGVSWDGPTYSLNYPESMDTTPKAYKMVLVEDGDESNPGHYKLVPVIDTTNDSSANNYLDGPTYSLNYPESMDTTPKAYKMVLVEDGDESNPGHYKLV
ncbi:MAG: hypothetical protein IJT68_06060, partial [Lentisphaeria bacterium]|nr:hypothetical protein [Lentisphaeria bacterium]